MRVTVSVVSFPGEIDLIGVITDHKLITWNRYRLCDNYLRTKECIGTLEKRTHSHLTHPACVKLKSLPGTALI